MYNNVDKPLYLAPVFVFLWSSRGTKPMYPEETHQSDYVIKETSIQPPNSNAHQTPIEQSRKFQINILKLPLKCLYAKVHLYTIILNISGRVLNILPVFIEVATNYRSVNTPLDIGR